MKKKLLFLLTLFSTFASTTFATHDIGGEISYRCLAPNSYLVTYSHYNWAGNNIQPTLVFKSPGCNNGRSVLMTQTIQRPGESIPSILGITNYKITTYTATITFTAAEQTCQDWVLRVGGTGIGQSSANMGINFNINTEATLKLNSNLLNNSPVWDDMNLPVILATKYQINNLNIGVYDTDGDSLSIHSVAPLDDNFQSRTNYNPINAIGGFFMNPNPPAPYNTTTNPQLGFFTGTNYSPTFPLMTYNANWGALSPATNTPYQVVPVQKFFMLDSLTGALSFKPMQFDTLNGGMNNGNNYLVSFKVDEWRKINGIPVKIGSIRRETMIVVGDGNANLNPNRAWLMLNTQALAAGTEIRIAPGTRLNLQFIGSDANIGDSLKIKSNAPAVLPGATYVVNVSSTPTGIVTWNPTQAEVREQPYYINFYVSDNASPMRGRYIETVAIRVTNSAGISGLKKDASNLGFIAYPNPFSETVNFKFNASKPVKEIRIYNMLGQEIDNFSVTGTENNITWTKAASHAAGTYVAKLIANDNSAQTIKFSKIQ